MKTLIILSAFLLAISSCTKCVPVPDPNTVYSPDGDPGYVDPTPDPDPYADPYYDPYADPNYDPGNDPGNYSGDNGDDNSGDDGGDNSGDDGGDRYHVHPHHSAHSQVIPAPPRRQ